MQSFPGRLKEEIADIVDFAALQILNPDKDKSLEFPGTYWVYIHVYNGEAVYVGITNSKRPEDRWQGGHGYKNSLFEKFITKAGWSKISHYIVGFDLSKDEAGEMETQLITRLKTHWTEGGYNSTYGGDSITGHNADEWTKAKQSFSHTGITHSDSERAKIARGMRGNNNAANAVVQISETGEVIAEYESAAAAERISGVDRKLISKVINGKQKTAGGYIWAKKAVEKEESEEKHE